MPGSATQVKEKPGQEEVIVTVEEEEEEEEKQRRMYNIISLVYASHTFGRAHHTLR